MIRLYSSNIMIGILLGICVGSQVFGGRLVDEVVGGMVICSIWGVCGL